MMKSCLILFVLLPTVISSDEANLANINFETILTSLGLPISVRSCVDPFIDILQQSFESGDPIKHLESICHNFNDTEKCMVEKNTASTSNIFNIATSGVDNLCTVKWPFLEKNKECINTHAGYKARACDSQCDMSKELSALSLDEEILQLSNNGGNMVKVLTKLDGVCAASRCFLPCYRNTLNDSCKRAGGMIVDSLLKPFYRLASFVEDAGPIVNAFLDNNMPQTCKFLTNKSILKGIRNGTVTAF